MKLEYKIPRGWRKLRVGEYPAIKGDLRPCAALRWEDAYNPRRIMVIQPGETVIRKIGRKKL